jgi:hypothetical protein
MSDFNLESPPARITNPTGLPAGALYPRHLFKYASAGSDASLIVAWRDGLPVYNDHQIVRDADAQAAAVDAGFSLTPVFTAPSKTKRGD